MEHCKHCGKTLKSGQRKFCSRSCSAKVSNLERVRRPWTDEQRMVCKEKKSKHLPTQIRKCRFCGQGLESVGRQKMCPACSGHYRYEKLYGRLGFTQGTLAERHKLATSLLKRQYEEAKMSLSELEKVYGINLNTLKRFFTANGITTRTHSQSYYEAFRRGKIGIIVPGPESKIRYREGWHTSWTGDKFYLRSSYEFDFAKELDSLKVPYQVEKIRIVYWDTQKQRERIAIPDFYLPVDNRLVEIKSTHTLDRQNMKDKFAAYVKAGYIYSLILEHKEVFLD